MGYCEFLTALFADGRVTVPDFSPLVDEEVNAGDEIIAEYERHTRLEMPGTAPAFIATAGRWAGTRFFRACQFLVYRDIGEKTVDEELGVPIGEPVSPDVHYCVDLVFRFLPDVTKFASSAAERDPLLDHLNDWARQWPLSSVGMSGIENVDIAGFENNVSLMRLYADRIIAKSDTSRLSDGAVRNAVGRALGMYSDLADGISTALLQYDSAERDQAGYDEQDSGP